MLPFKQIESHQLMKQNLRAFFTKSPEPIIQSLAPFQNGIFVDVLREDLMFPVLSGNKFRKLKYHLIENEFNCCLSFGGNYSNHVYALAEAKKLFGFDVHVFHPNTNCFTPTLTFAKQAGVHLHPLPYSQFRKRADPNFIQECMRKVNAEYCIPEGGAGDLGIKGCMEILAHPAIKLHKYDAVAVAAGTGNMLAGIMMYLEKIGSKMPIIVQSALKQVQHIEQLITDLKLNIQLSADTNRIHLYAETEFGGFGKYNQTLIEFMLNQYHLNKLEFDHVYTAKLLHRLQQMEHYSSFKRVLMIHSGGLQGRNGMQKDLKD